MSDTDNNIVKVSVCNICNNWVRVADKKYLDSDTKARNEFKNEAFEHNLEVKELSFKEFKKDFDDMCSCEQK